MPSEAKPYTTWIWSDNETLRRGSGKRRVLVKSHPKAGMCRLYDPRDPDSYPDVVSLETLLQLQREEKGK